MEEFNMSDREDLETRTKEEVCACRVYDLADNIDTMTDKELQDIIDHKAQCEICGK
jgi:redox-regulated HSP33 family molecular chaperone